ncbi:MAG: hypothetical protein R3E12_05805 [Candidatus Eisenbacteria bacterium]
MARAEWERAFSVLGELERIAPGTAQPKPAQAPVMPRSIGWPRRARGGPPPLEEAMKQGS